MASAGIKNNICQNLVGVRHQQVA